VKGGGSSKREREGNVACDSRGQNRRVLDGFFVCFVYFVVALRVQKRGMPNGFWTGEFVQQAAPDSESGYRGLPTREPYQSPTTQE